MCFIFLIFYACLRLRFPDVESNPGPRRPVPDILQNTLVMCRACPETLVTCQYDIQLCSVTLISDMRHVLGCWLPDLVPGFVL